MAKYIEDMKTHNLHINDNDSDTTNLHVHVIPGWDQGPYVREMNKTRLKRPEKRTMLMIPVQLIVIVQIPGPSQG